MKKISLLLMVILLAGSLYAGGEDEGAVETESYELTFMNNGIVKFPEAEAKFKTEVGVVEKVIADFMRKYPNVNVDIVYRDISKGSLTYDTMLAAGTPPDVWIDASFYFANLLNEDYAIPLEGYGDLSIYNDALLDLYKFDGHQYAIPLVNIAVGMVVNVSMLKDVGLELPPQEEWTTDKFLEISEALKEGGHLPHMVQGRNGLNGWTCYWFYAHGARFFAPGDWSKVTINSPEALEALAFMRLLAEKGYTTEPLTTYDDMAVEWFTTNRLFSSAMQNGHVDPSFPVQLEKGKIDVIPEYTFVEFPHAPGMDHTPVSGYQTVASGHISGDPNKDKIIAELTYAVTNEEVQYYYAVVGGGFPTIKGLNPTFGDAGKPSYQAIAKLAPQAGTYKQWPDGPARKEVARLWGTLSEQWVRGKLGDQALLSQFEAEANQILRNYY